MLHNRNHLDRDNKGGRRKLTLNFCSVPISPVRRMRGSSASEIAPTNCSPSTCEMDKFHAIHNTDLSSRSSTGEGVT